MSYKPPFNHIKTFIRMVESRIPLNVKIVAEVRGIWLEVVGESMAKRSKVAKCEYLPKKDENGNDTGVFNRRLVVLVSDNATQSAMATYASEYLERLPKRLKIHSLRFQYSKYPLSFREEAYVPQKPTLNLTSFEKNTIRKKVESMSMSPELSEQMIHYLYSWKNIQNKERPQ